MKEIELNLTQEELDALTPEEIEKLKKAEYRKRMKKLSKEERKKFRVIEKLLNGEINGTEAANKLKITTRQVRNLKRQVNEQGFDGVVHKNKQYKPYNTYDSEISTFVCKLYRREYRGTNFSEFARIVQEEHGIKASRSTIYNFLRRGHIRSPQRKIKKRLTLKQIQAMEEAAKKKEAQKARAATKKAKTTNTKTSKTSSK